MKTIKYLSDGTVAKVGMRVKTTIGGMPFIVRIVKIRDNILPSSITGKIKVVDSDPTSSIGFFYRYPSDCTPIK